MLWAFAAWLALPGSGGDSPARLTARIATLEASSPAPSPSASPARPAPRRPLPSGAPAQPSPLPGLPGIRYYTVAELEVRPQVATQVMPEYPANVFSGTRGRVVLRVLIGADGAVDGVQVAAAQPAGLFEEAATRAFASARFMPGEIRGTPVPSQLLIEVTFGD